MTSVDQINRRLNKAVMTTFYGPEPRGEVECLRCGGTFSVGVRGNCTKAALQHARTEHAKEAAEAEAKVNGQKPDAGEQKQKQKDAQQKQKQGVGAVTRGAKAQVTEKSALTTSSETGEKGTGSEPLKEFPDVAVIDIDEDDDEEDAPMPMPLAQPDGMGNYALERNRGAARDAFNKANEEVDDLKRKLQEVKAVKREAEVAQAADKICVLIQRCMDWVASTSIIERE